MLNNFILAVKVTGILAAIVITLGVYACCVVGGRSDKK